MAAATNRSGSTGSPDGLELSLCSAICMIGLLEGSIRRGGTSLQTTQRIDKWLWHARVTKTRGLAQKLAVSGHVRVNREKIDAASKVVRLGDVLTIALDRRVLVLKVAAIGGRRGPAAEARLLYEDLSPPANRNDAGATPAPRETGAGRPTKRQRRQIDALRGGSE